MGSTFSIVSIVHFAGFVKRQARFDQKEVFPR